MFPTQIGPSGTVKGFLRPETAQGIFVNFRDLLYYNGVSFAAAAQIGQSFRNEIAPRAGLLRVREFTQAEIEHFVHPGDTKNTRVLWKSRTPSSTSLAKTPSWASVKKPFLMTVGEAVSKGIIANETLGYFIARCHLFLEQIGIDLTKLRFRQHLKHEMATTPPTAGTPKFNVLTVG